MINRYRIWLWASGAGWVFFGAWVILAAAQIAPPLHESVRAYCLSAVVASTLVGAIGRFFADVGRGHDETTEHVVTAFQHGYDLRGEECARYCRPRQDAKILAFPTQRDPGRRGDGRPAIADPNATTMVLPRLPGNGRHRRPSPRRSGRLSR